MGTPFASLSFQARLTLVAATAVAATVGIAAAAIYFAAQNSLYAQIDESLHAQADNTSVHPPGGPCPGVDVAVPTVPFGGARGYFQILCPDGEKFLAAGETTPLPVTEGDRRVVSGQDSSYPHNAYINGVHVRILTTRITDTITLQAARPLKEVDQSLVDFKLVLLAVAAGGIALAAVLGWLIAQTGLWPIYRLRAAVDHVTLTGDMSQRVPYEGDDELGLLGAHFNRMLGGLDQSLRTQRQLVADASHELRTPLASLRTNVEVLQRAPELPPPERQKLLKDVVSQVEQLTRLIGDLIDLARGDQTPEEKEEVRLDWIVAEAVERAATHWPAVRFDADLSESVVLGQARRLDRAVSNLLDNAGKWSPAGGRVEVRVNDHELTVRDHGPGIDPADLPYVFDRFWRAPDARGMQGSGLGLAIVRQVAEAHDAIVGAELPQDGGTLMRLRFSVS